MIITELFALFEYDQSKTLQAFGQGLVNAAANDKSIADFLKKNLPPENHAMFLVKKLEMADPTPHKEYVQWLARLYATNGGKIWMEDIASKGRDALEAFDAAKKRKKLPPESRDINRIKSLKQLLDVVDTIPQEEPKQDVDKGKSKVFFEDDTIRIIDLLDVTASMYYGQNTRWCTAARNDNMFETYTRDGAKLYVLLPKKPKYVGEKYQVSFEFRQFMDPKDEPIDQLDFYRAYPTARLAFRNDPIANKDLLVSAADISEEGLQNGVENWAQKFLTSLQTMSMKLTDSNIRQLFGISDDEGGDSSKVSAEFDSRVKAVPHELAAAINDNEAFTIQLLQEAGSYLKYDVVNRDGKNVKITNYEDFYFELEQIIIENQTIATMAKQIYVDVFRKLQGTGIYATNNGVIQFRNILTKHVMKVWYLSGMQSFKGDGQPEMKKAA